MPVEDELLTKEDTVRLKRCLYALQRNDLPPVTTHNVVNDWSDPVLNTIRRCKLFNTTSDKVKVRYHKSLISNLTYIVIGSLQYGLDVTGSVPSRVFVVNQPIVRIGL